MIPTTNFFSFIHSASTDPSSPTTASKSRKNAKQLWSPVEDDILREQVCNVNSGNWTNISKLLPNRTPKQCRERWVYNLKPGLKKGDWKEEEDQIILSMHQRCGNQWSNIAAKLEGRTDIDVKNRFNALKNARLQHIISDDTYETTAFSRSFSTQNNSSLFPSNVSSSKSIGSSNESVYSEMFSNSHDDAINNSSRSEKSYFSSRDNDNHNHIYLSSSLSSMTVSEKRPRLNTCDNQSVFSSQNGDKPTPTLDTFNLSTYPPSKTQNSTMRISHVPVFTQFPSPIMPATDTDKSRTMPNLLFDGQQEEQMLSVLKGNISTDDFASSHDVSTMTIPSISNPLQNQCDRDDHQQRHTIRDDDLNNQDISKVIIKNVVNTDMMAIMENEPEKIPNPFQHKLLPVPGHPYLFYDPSHPTVQELSSLEKFHFI